MGSQYPSPNVKTLCNFEPQSWPEIITSRDAESTCFKGSRTSCDVIIFGMFLPNFSQKRLHHVMDASCRYHHHPESKKRKSSEANSGSIHPYSRYGILKKTRKTMPTIAVFWPVKAIFEKRAATVEVDTLISPVRDTLSTAQERSSRGRPRRYPGGRPGAKTSVRPSRPWKTSISVRTSMTRSADVHDPRGGRKTSG